MTEGAGILYITGAGHSGSSLLDKLLGQQPGISSGGEWHRLSLSPDERLCSCGQAVDDCPRWRKVRELLSINSFANLPVSSAPADAAATRRELWTLRVAASSGLRLGLHSDKPLAATHRLVAKNSWKLADALALAEQSQWIIDSTKTPQRLLDLLQHAESARRELKALHLVRDGRAVMASALRRTQQTPQKAAWEWAMANLKTEVAMRRIRHSDRMRITYEDLCDDVELVTSRIVDWLGVPRTSTSDRTFASDGDSHLIPGNPSLFQPIRSIVADDRWRSELTQENLATFARSAGWLNRRYGYQE